MIVLGERSANVVQWLSYLEARRGRKYYLARRSISVGEYGYSSGSISLNLGKKGGERMRLIIMSARLSMAKAEGGTRSIPLQGTVSTAS